MEAKTYTITNGPSTLDLSISLFRRNHGDDVRFALNGVEHAPMCYITGAQARDDSSTGGWNLRGYLTFGLITQTFTASYSTSSRRGTFTVLKPKKR